MYTIRCADGAVFNAQLGETILDAAIGCQVGIPHSCRTGNCGTCKCRLRSGEIEMAPYSEFALTEEERGAGLFLACRAVAWSDCEIALVGGAERVVHPSRKLVCRVVGLEMATHDIRVLRLAIEGHDRLLFSAGQFAELTFGCLPGRSYSMANAPGSAELEFHVRRVPGGLVSAHVLERLKLGDPVGVAGPYGSAYLREAQCAPLLCVAGGSGLAPIRSIVLTALAQDPTRTVHLYFGARAERDVYREAEFIALARSCPGFRHTIVLSEPDSTTARCTGLVTEAIAADLPNVQDCQVHLCGPPAMVEAAQSWLAGQGCDRANVHADAFYTAADTAATARSA